MTNLVCNNAFSLKLKYYVYIREITSIRRIAEGWFESEQSDVYSNRFTCGACWALKKHPSWGGSGQALSWSEKGGSNRRRIGSGFDDGKRKGEDDERKADVQRSYIEPDGSAIVCRS